MNKIKLLKQAVLVFITFSFAFSLSMIIPRVTAPLSRPTIYSCDDGGYEKNVFHFMELVYACGNNYDPYESVIIYVVQKGGPYKSGASISDAVTTTDESGILSPTNLSTFDLGEYDIWVDRDGNGLLNYLTEPVYIFGTCPAGFSVVSELCEVTFLTDPVCSCYYITFEGATYHNGAADTFAYGTSGPATAHCCDGWVFDHWEVTGNVEVSSTTVNPTTVTITCGGTLKAVCRCGENPAALFTRTPSEPYKGQTVIFNASSSYDPDGFIVSYTWDFSDGNITITSNPVIIHRYVSIGTYNVTLTVTDNDGLNDSAKNHLTIRTLTGDLNGDLIVNILDITAVAKAFGSNLQDPDWNAMVDLDNNGIINIIDIAIVAAEYGKTVY